MFLRHDKARRAYDNAARLRALGVDTPHEVACLKIVKGFLLQESYFVSLYTDATPFDRTIDEFPAPEACRIADAFTAFIARVHDSGILHHDLNAGNIRYREVDGRLSFELIDTNRMSFKRRLTEKERLINLRRLTHRAAPYIYICNRYVASHCRDKNRSLLRSCIYLLLFDSWSTCKQRIKSFVRGSVKPAR